MTNDELKSRIVAVSNSILKKNGLESKVETEKKFGDSTVTVAVERFRTCVDFKSKNDKKKDSDVRSEGWTLFLFSKKDIENPDFESFVEACFLTRDLYV